MHRDQSSPAARNTHRGNRAKREARPSNSAFQRLESIAKAGQSVVLSLISVSLFVIVLLLAWRHARQGDLEVVVQVRPFHVTEAVTKSGYSGQVLAALAADQLARMSEVAAKRSSARRQFGSAHTIVAYRLDPTFEGLNVQIPGAGLTINDLIQTVRAALATRQVEIAGEVIEQEGVMKLVLHVRDTDRREDASITEVGSEVESLLEVAVRKAALRMSPILMTNYLLLSEGKRCTTTPPCDFSESIAVIHHVLRHGSPQTHGQAYMGWCYALAVSGDHAGAANKCRLATQLSPNESVSFQNWGLALNQLGEYASATEKFTRAVELDRRNTSALLGWGDALWLLHRPDESFEKYRRALAMAPDQGAYLAWGSRLMTLGRNEEARNRLMQGIRLNPANPGAWRVYSICMSRLNRIDDEVESLRNAVELAPDDATYRYSLGLALQEQGQPALGEQAFRDAIELLKHDPMPKALPYLGLGRVLMDQKKYLESIAANHRSNELEATADAYANIGLALSYLKRHDEALAEFEKATNLDSDRKDAYVNWADALLALKRYPEAFTVASKAIPMVGGYVNRAQASASLGMYDEAIRDYQAALAIDGRNADAYQGWGDVLIKKGRPAEAARKHRKATSLRHRTSD